MEPRIIGIIVSCCIIAVAIPAIIIKYFMRNKESKSDKKIKTDTNKIANKIQQENKENKKD